MNDRAAFEAWIAENWPNLAAPWWLSSEDAIQQFDAFSAGAKYGAKQSSKLADALQELLNDTQHRDHPSCEDGGYCPVRDAREALAEFEATGEPPGEPSRKEPK